MGMERESWENEWAGLEPKQPRSGQWGCWLGVFLLVIILLAACGIGGYLAWQQFDLQLGPGLVLAPPTALSPGSEPEETETPSPGDDSLAMAATVTLPAEQTADTVEVGQLPAAALIDGNLTEWADGPSVESRYVVYSVNGWDGSDDVLARWHLGWDSSHLFIAVQVEDNIHVQTQSGNQIFRGDGISLQIDSDRAGDFGPRLSRDDFQINLSPGDFASIAPSAFRFQGTNDGGTVDAPGHGIEVAARQNGQGYDLEAAVPWQDIGLTPAVGLVVGAALNVNDNDTPGTAVQEVMKSHVATRAFRDPTSWGTLTLQNN